MACADWSTVAMIQLEFPSIKIVFLLSFARRTISNLSSNSSFTTALMQACRYGHWEVVQTLLFRCNNKAMKGGLYSSVVSLNKNASQIRKSSHRKTSLNWFPRQKVDSYLKRKLMLMQEVGGMNSTRS